jgi:hypothetical protein
MYLIIILCYCLNKNNQIDNHNVSTQTIDNFIEQPLINYDNFLEQPGALY